MRHLEEYRAAVTERVCAKCVDAGPQGECRLPSQGDCALLKHFESAVDAILSVMSPSVAPYGDAIRNRVCTQCGHRPDVGPCRQQRDLECGLDRYLPLVVEAIEETHALLQVS